MTNVKLPYLGFESFEALAEDTARLFKEAIVVPNHLLPAEYQNHKEWDLNDRGEKVYGPTLAQIENHWQKHHAERQERRRHNDERSRRVERMAAEFAEHGEFEYDEFVVDGMSPARPKDMSEIF